MKPTATSRLDFFDSSDICLHVAAGHSTAKDQIELNTECNNISHNLLSTADTAIVCRLRTVLFSVFHGWVDDRRWPLYCLLYPVSDVTGIS